MLNSVLEIPLKGFNLKYSCLLLRCGFLLCEMPVPMIIGSWRARSVRVALFVNSPWMQGTFSSWRFMWHLGPPRSTTSSYQPVPHLAMWWSSKSYNALPEFPDPLSLASGIYSDYTWRVIGSHMHLYCGLGGYLPLLQSQVLVHALSPFSLTIRIVLNGTGNNSTVLFQRVCMISLLTPRI